MVNTTFSSRGTALVILAFLASHAVVAAQAAAASDEDRFRLLRRPGANRPELADRFDVDKDGVLNKAERVSARRFLQQQAIDAALAEFQRQDKNQDGGVSREELDTGRNNSLRDADTNGDGVIDEAEAVATGFRANFGAAEYAAAISNPQAESVPTQALPNPGGGLYDENVLRTFFFDFEDNDWLGEMHDFYHSDINVPAKLTVDGQVYSGVGLRYRGNSSFFLMAPDKKRSLNLSLDYSKKGGELDGYQTLNLHNGAEDPTFMREVLYLKICREYMPAFHANFVKVVINGESWGVYLNVQQYNSDFARDWFGSKKGVRWKAAGGPGKKGLSYEGEDPAAYRGYALKSDDAPERALTDLIHLCRVLDQTPDAELETKLAPIFDVDGALWSLALENVFVDEGYVIRISDYDIFQDRNGRFHLLQHDGNEVFNIPHGPGLPRGFDATKLDPFHNLDNRDYAVIHRLLKVPRLRARYVAHVRTILDEWFRWDRLEPVIAGYRSLIGDDVRRDVRKLYSTEDYERGLVETVNHGETMGIKEFVDRRREFLLNHEALQASAPQILSVNAAPANAEGIHVRAKLAHEVAAETVLLHWAPKRNQPYALLTMSDDGRHGDGAANDGVYGATIPAQPADSKFFYYVEARTGGENQTAAFHPTRAEAAPLAMTVD